MSRVALLPCPSYEPAAVERALRRGIQILGGTRRFEAGASVAFGDSSGIVDSRQAALRRPLAGQAGRLGPRLNALPA